MPDWVDCPICGEPDMRRGDGLISCVNLSCASNGGRARRDTVAEAVEESRRIRRNWRGRRLMACRSADEFDALIEALGVEDGSELPPSDQGLPTPPTPAQKRELQNTVANLLRTFLLWNDGGVSPQKLQRF